MVIARVLYVVAAVAGCLALGAAACSSPGPTGFTGFVPGVALGDAGPPPIIGGEGGTLWAVAAAGRRVRASGATTCPGDPGAAAVWVTISGESNALTGYPFPPKDFGSDTYMFDGWEIRIQEYIVDVDDIVLWSNPNKEPALQSDPGDEQVAHLSGPFVVDLHKGGHVSGQGGPPEEATPIGVITSQNDNGGAPFATDGTTYGFGFRTVQATYDAYNVNLDDGEAADFALMVDNGYSVLYVGTATWRGDDPANPYACTQTFAGPPAVDAGVVQGATRRSASTFADGGYDFGRMDRLTFAFKLGFATPTRYVNCQNRWR